MSRLSSEKRLGAQACGLPRQNIVAVRADLVGMFIACQHLSLDIAAVSCSDVVSCLSTDRGPVDGNKYDPS